MKKNYTLGLLLFFGVSIHAQVHYPIVIPGTKFIHLPFDGTVQNEGYGPDFITNTSNYVNSPLEQSDDFSALLIEPTTVVEQTIPKSEYEDASQNFTIGTWIKVNSLPITTGQYRNIFEIGADHFLRFLSTAQPDQIRLEYGWRRGGTNYTTIVKDIDRAVLLDNWSHIALTNEFNAGTGERTVKFYLNAGEIATGTFGGSFAPIEYGDGSIKMVIGTRDGNTNFTIDAELAHFTWYTSVLNIGQLEFLGCFNDARVTQDENIYSVTDGYYGYQWFRCLEGDNEEALMGETERSIDLGNYPAGEYKVYKSFKGNEMCWLYSFCFQFGDLSVDAANAQEVKVYPNPTSDVLVLEGFKAGTELQLVNNIGQQVQSLTVEQLYETMDISRHNPGIYYLYTSGGGIQKIVISK